MKIGPWISADVQACVEPHPIAITKVELEELHATHIIEVGIWRQPSQDMSETCKINMSTFDDGQAEEFLALLRNSKIRIDGTGTNSPSGWMNYLPKMLC